MRAAIIRPPRSGQIPYAFPINHAPTSAIEVRDDIPKPKVSKPGELLIQVKASTIIRDNLDWHEVYPPWNGRLGNDFAGVVVDVHEGEQDFRVGDHVFGLAHARRGGIWADYAIVLSEEAHKKPDSLSWEEAAALPASTLTADQALFVHAGLETKAKQPKRILITGASGCIGMWLVQFAVAAGHHVVAATSSNERNESFLRSIGAHEVVEYGDLGTVEKPELIIDSCGNQVLIDCWDVVKPDGMLMSFDTNGWDFIEEHKRKGISKGKDGVQAVYFIVEPSRVSMERILERILQGNMKGNPLKTVPLQDVREAYESVHFRGAGQGCKIIVVP